MRQLTQSDNHNIIKQRLEQFAADCETLDQYARLLRKAKIFFRDVYEKEDRHLLIYTGASTYDIIGCTAKWEGDRIVLEDTRG